ncbi:B9 domain-containing protein 2 isoform X2 [Vanessa atalanta]|uniref:B9 domain-containing protein 2 isoform X2 n=1 Tax=Vanessa atalanta TaxID=42275 RepID=UPI001FCCC4A4|nr:B9 domain-containing protein 2 isoform X2 [Vanessa atalanta]
MILLTAVFQYTFCNAMIYHNSTLTQTGPNWTLISGFSEGQTASGKENFKNSVEWVHPLDLHYVCKGIQGWPKIILQVSCLDSIGRSWVVGYGCCALPSTPGYHTIKVPCWVPAATTVTERLKQYFIGGGHELTQTDIINLGSDRFDRFIEIIFNKKKIDTIFFCLNRFKLITQSKGEIKLNICIVLRNLTQFGVEYK